MTLRSTLILGLAFSNLATIDFQYGVLLALYWAMTTLMVPLALPPELLPPPPLLLRLPPHAAPSPTPATAATAPAARVHRARRGRIFGQAPPAPRLIDISKALLVTSAAGRAAGCLLSPGHMKGYLLNIAAYDAPGRRGGQGRRSYKRDASQGRAGYQPEGVGWRRRLTAVRRCCARSTAPTRWRRCAEPAR